MKLVELKLNCCGGEHIVSVYEPGDKWACLPEREILGPNGCRICLEDHNYEIEKVFYELGTTVPTCVNVIREKDHLLRKALYDELDETRGIWVEAAVVAICAGSYLNIGVSLLLFEVATTENFQLFKHLIEVHESSYASIEHSLLGAAEYGSLEIMKYLLESNKIDPLCYQTYDSMKAAALLERTDSLECWIDHVIHNVSRYSKFQHWNDIKKLLAYLKLIRHPVPDTGTEIANSEMLKYLDGKIQQLSSLMERGVR